MKVVTEAKERLDSAGQNMVEVRSALWVGSVGQNMVEVRLALTVEFAGHHTLEVRLSELLPMLELVSFAREEPEGFKALFPKRLKTGKAAACAAKASTTTESCIPSKHFVQLHWRSSRAMDFFDELLCPYIVFMVPTAHA